jgi:hypothetical protein
MVIDLSYPLSCDLAAASSGARSMHRSSDAIACSRHRAVIDQAEPAAGGDAGRGPVPKTVAERHRAACHFRHPTGQA